ncbi:MAG: dinitrogenase iron-molybdenum cofactor biosynthesis protein [Deltaproteobacteria bacterium]|nr:MAG: dinitrogenase iron-molybdenum cofactor biosynthesis protein [Deltaproteobacteria bacterium]
MSNIAITVAAGQGDLSAPMDGRFGRAEQFLIVDSETGEVLRALENPAINDAHGAGTGAAALMKKEGIEAVVSGRFGPKAFEALTGLEIVTWIAPSGLTAAQALALFQQGQLERMQLQIIR